MNEIPLIVEMLYTQWVPPPQPERWPEVLQSNHVKGHGMFSFYEGLKLGLQLSFSCMKDD